MLANTLELCCRGQQSVPIDDTPIPSAALEALLPLDASLLESRTTHPGARYSYVAFSPLATLRLGKDALHVFDTPDAAGRKFGWRPVERLLAELEAVRSQHASDEAPFTAGWIGYFAHEFGCRLLDVPAAQPCPPARPVGPLAVFRLYRDAFVIDHHENTATLHGSDWGEGAEAVRTRLEEAQSLLGGPVESATAPDVAETSSVTLTPDAFAGHQASLQALIREGDCFQANLTSSWAWPWRGATPSVAELVALYRRYGEANPGAWCAFFQDDAATILSGSPELLVDWRGEELSMRPIAGTRPRGNDEAGDAALARELRDDPKEQAEHAMLVDLVRNDLAHVCEAGSVRITNLSGVERYRHVMHLVSEVKGRADANLELESLIRAVFPGGTVTGAPKRRALQRIGELERGPRGPYTGALGYVALGGASQFNLMIRTLTATPTHLVAHAGCGIVVDSRAELEAAELAAKARAQAQAALGEATPAAAADRCGEVAPGPGWQPGGTRKRGDSRRVVIVDFEDSFVHNLADYCRRAGAETEVVSAHAAPEPAWREAVTHLVLSPGPGRPADFPGRLRHLELAEARSIPILGVCLGHQALAEAAGARIVCHAETVHGRGSRLQRLPAAQNDPLFGVWCGQTVGRYHSLVVMDASPAMEPLATLADDTLMAVRYRDRPHWGVQFHPESLLTDGGLELIGAFLEVARR